MNTINPLPLSRLRRAPAKMFLGDGTLTQRITKPANMHMSIYLAIHPSMHVDTYGALAAPNGDSPHSAESLLKAGRAIFKDHRKHNREGPST